MKHLIDVAVLFGIGLWILAVPVRPASTELVVTEATVNAPIGEVWKMFTTKGGIESWMVTKTDIDFRVGGLWHTSYSKESTLDDDLAIHHIILAYDPERMLVFRTIKPPKNFAFPNAILKTWSVVYLEPAGESRTKVTTRMLGFGEDDESKRMRAFFETGNKTTLDHLVNKYR